MKVFYFISTLSITIPSAFSSTPPQVGIIKGLHSQYNSRKPNFSTESNATKTPAYVYQCEGCNDDPHYITRTTLEDLIDYFRSFIGMDGFRFKDFMHTRRILFRHLVDLDEEVSQLKSPDQHLSNELRYAYRLYKVMVDASESILFFSHQCKSSYLVRQVIQINLVLMWLHTNEGRPNSLILDYCLLVARLDRVLKEWGEEFRNLGEVPISLTIMFDSQYERAIKTLEVMKSLV